MDHADYGIDLLFNRGLIEKFKFEDFEKPAKKVCF